jgi:hypothetical protein
MMASDDLSHIISEPRSAHRREIVGRMDQRKRDLFAELHRKPWPTVRKMLEETDPRSFLDAVMQVSHLLTSRTPTAAVTGAQAAAGAQGLWHAVTYGGKSTRGYVNSGDAGSEGNRRFGLGMWTLEWRPKARSRPVGSVDEAGEDPEVEGPGISRHHAQNVVWGHVPQTDAIRFTPLMTGKMTADRFREAEGIYRASGMYDPTCERFFARGPR